MYKLFAAPSLLFGPDGAAGGTDGNSAGAGSAGTTPPPGKTFTEEDVNKIVKERLDRDDNTRLKKLLEELGLGTVDDLKSTVTEAKTAKQNQMTETERLKTELQAAKEKAEKAEKAGKEALAQATEKLMRAAVMTVAANLEDIHFRKDALADVWTFVDKATIKETAPGEFDGIEDALKKVAEAKPFLIEEAPVAEIGSPRMPASANSKKGTRSTDDIAAAKQKSGRYSQL